MIEGRILIMYEVSRPLSDNLKGGYHMNYPFGYVGRGLAYVVTHRLILPRHRTGKAHDMSRT